MYLVNQMKTNMRKNAKRVERLKENLIKELKYWFSSRPSVLKKTQKK